MEVGDAFAFYMMGCAHSHGRYGLTRDSAKAMALWRKAAKFGYNDIGHAYHYGDGVERDAKIASHYYEIAAWREIHMQGVIWDIARRMQAIMIKH